MRVLRSWGITPEKVKAKLLTGLRQWNGQGELLLEAPVPGEDVGGGVVSFETNHRNNLSTKSAFPVHKSSYRHLRSVV